MGRTALWTEIAESLRRDLSEGRFRVGEKLPTEAELSIRFGVNRHTVRRALAALAQDGQVHPKRGAGVFVTTPPTNYPLGKRVRFSQNVEASGRTPGRTILQIETRFATEEETKALKLGMDEKVHLAEDITLADDVPIAVSLSAFPAKAMPRFPALLRELRSITKTLSAVGVDDYTRAQTTLTAVAATAIQSRRLRVSEGAPLLYSVAVNVDKDGTPIEYGRTWFAGDRVNMSVTADA
ncbi:MAG: phosphonate metabolism transcriptional regulator PhnF [Pseudomonadota bacterium]